MNGALEINLDAGPGMRRLCMVEFGSSRASASVAHPCGHRRQMSIFGELLVRLDPWQVDYGAELQLDEGEDAGQDDGVALDVELPPEEWRPISPKGTTAPAQLIFVDGVRQIEARLIIRRQERVCHGGFGSHAVGAVAVAARAASTAASRVGRLLVIGSGKSIDSPITVTCGLTYLPVSTADTDPDGPLRAIQEHMRIEEERLGRELADTEGTLVVADGPLTFQEASRGAVLGYIKRIFKLYVPREHLDLLARLRAGERTPVFAIRSSRRFVRFSWFVQLAMPQVGTPNLRVLRAWRCRRRLVPTSHGGWQMRAQRSCRGLCQADGAIPGARKIFFPSEHWKQACGDTWAMGG